MIVSIPLILIIGIKCKQAVVVVKICQRPLVENVRHPNFNDHNAMIYPDLSTFRLVYSRATKEALERNEIVFLAMTYDSFQSVMDSLTHIGVFQ